MSTDLKSATLITLVSPCSNCLQRPPGSFSWNLEVVFPGTGKVNPGNPGKSFPRNQKVVSREPFESLLQRGEPLSSIDQQMTSDWYPCASCL